MTKSVGYLYSPFYLRCQTYVCFDYNRRMDANNQQWNIQFQSLLKTIENSFNMSYVTHRWPIPPSWSNVTLSMPLHQTSPIFVRSLDASPHRETPRWSTSVIVTSGPNVLWHNVWLIMQRVMCWGWPNMYTTTWEGESTTNLKTLHSFFKHISISEPTSHLIIS